MQHQMIFVNLPVEDTERSREFYTALGYTFDERMCQAGTALALEIGPQKYAMLLDQKFFADFHSERTAAADQHEVLLCVSAESKDEVNGLVDRAIAAGGTDVRTEEQPFMFGRSYADPDGHIWEVMWMDVAAATKAGAFG